MDQTTCFLRHSAMKKITDDMISVIIPAKDEETGLRKILPSIRNILDGARIIVVNDGSVDDTGKVAADYADRVIHHPHSMGNGAAVKAGARAATREIFIFMDADGQHSPQDIRRLIEKLDEGHIMAVGARHPSTHAGWLRRMANFIFNRLASYLTDQSIQDLTSGFRAVYADDFREFLYLLPNGFSYPATITMALSRNGKTIAYVPIHAGKRSGKSHINLIRDGIRFFIIIFKISALYSPLKIFAPASLFCFIVGNSYYLYTYATDGRFTNMGLLLFVLAMLVFMIGLVSEQITTLLYATSENHTARRSAIEQSGDRGAQRNAHR